MELIFSEEEKVACKDINIAAKSLFSSDVEKSALEESLILFIAGHETSANATAYTATPNTGPIPKGSIHRASPKRRGYFAVLYQKVTKKVKEGIEHNFFDDGARMEHFLVNFIIGKARAGAWKFAERIAHRSCEELQPLIARRDRQTARIALLIGHPCAILEMVIRNIGLSKPGSVPERIRGLRA